VPKNFGPITGGTGDCYRIAEGDAGLDPRDVLREFLWESGYVAATLPLDLFADGIRLLHHGRLWSVIATDLDEIEDVEPGQYHSDGSGKRSKHFWWVESPWNDYLDRIAAND
jgi:hypothetical protein